jgi:hypothetical protein
MKPLILDPQEYNDSHIISLFEELKTRVITQPINLFFLLLFLLATLHIFLCYYFMTHSKGKHPFFAELEIIFGLWCIPLILGIGFFHGFDVALNYLNTQNYNEALLIIVSMSVASTYPITHLAELLLKKGANLIENTPNTWWWLIMTLGPLMGSLVKETVAMTISAFLLSKYFFSASPSKRLSYATLSLLFVNISVGGSLTPFATSAISIAAKPWGWDTLFMFQTFGWRALLGILICNATIFTLFKKDFESLQQKRPEHQERNVPFFVTLVHILMLIWIAINQQNTVVVLGSFVIFLGFIESTRKYQKNTDLKEPILVGFFIASVIVLGNTQIWWVEPLMTRFNEVASMKLTMVLSALMRNTTISYMLTKIPNLTPQLKYALFSGMMIGGGLTLIGNGPNLIATSILKKHFKGNVNLGTLFLYTLLPAFLMTLIFY